jgi:hypothetical protein
MFRQRRRKRVEPVRCAQVITEIVAQRNVGEAQSHDRQMAIYRELHFAEHLLGLIRMARKNEEQYFGLLDRARDLTGKRLPRPYIARRHPAPDPIVFQRGANRLRRFFVLRRMRDENVTGHTLAASFLVVPRQPGNGN